MSFRMKDGAPTLSSARKTGVRLLAVLGLASFSLVFLVAAADALGLISTEPVGSPNDPPPSPAARAGAEAPGEGVHVVGSLAVLAIAGSGLVALFARPERSGSAYQVMAVVAGLLVTMFIVGDPDNYGGQAAVIDPVFLAVAVPPLGAAAAARPWRSWRTKTYRPSFLALAAVGAAPASWYGLDQALMQRNTFPPTADPHHQAHWLALSVFAFAVVLVVATAAISARGSRLAAAVAGLSAVAFGIASVTSPAAASAVGPAWGAAAVVWGVLVVLYTARESKESVAGRVTAGT